MGNDDAAAFSNGVLIGDGAVCKHWLHDALRLPNDSIYLTHGVRVAAVDDLRNALATAIGADKPTCINASISNVGLAPKCHC